MISATAGLSSESSQTDPIRDINQLLGGGHIMPQVVGLGNPLLASLIEAQLQAATSPSIPRLSAVTALNSSLLSQSEPGLSSYLQSAYLQQNYLSQIAGQSAVMNNVLEQILMGQLGGTPSMPNFFPSPSPATSNPFAIATDPSLQGMRIPQIHHHHHQRILNATSDQQQRPQKRQRLDSDSSLPRVLALPEDHDILSEHQIFLRSQIEAFCASRDDVSTHTRGRNKPVALGQVGIRCRHCAHVPVRQRQKGSTYFPASLLGLYQAAQNMCSTHMQSGLCDQMPLEVRQQFLQLLTSKVSGSGAGRPYWARSATKLGLVDTEDGIRLAKQLKIDGSSQSASIQPSAI
mmetsp:Transcript_28004/g.68177  ORF Transcript_28004/g.68177 Transcript_28004/m.68177 type:complete len:347 (+) Transcript_28004:290-1330(+)